jgi:hypothetical protein
LFRFARNDDVERTEAVTPAVVPANPANRGVLGYVLVALRLLVKNRYRIGGCIRRALVVAAKKKSGIDSDKVALEDGFVTKLVRRKGRIAQDVDLSFDLARSAAHQAATCGWFYPAPFN